MAAIIRHSIGSLKTVHPRKTAMTRAELIALANQILACNGSEAEIDALMEQFDQNVPHPDGASLLFYPEHGSASGYAPSAEEVVDKCLAYRPIILPYNTP